MRLKVRMRLPDVSGYGSSSSRTATCRPGMRGLKRWEIMPEEGTWGKGSIGRCQDRWDLYVLWSHRSYRRLLQRYLHAFRNAIKSANSWGVTCLSSPAGMMETLLGCTSSMSSRGM